MPKSMRTRHPGQHRHSSQHQTTHATAPMSCIAHQRRLLTWHTSYLLLISSSEFPFPMTCMPHTPMLPDHNDQSRRQRLHLNAPPCVLFAHTPCQATTAPVSSVSPHHQPTSSSFPMSTIASHLSSLRTSSPRKLQPVSSSPAYMDAHHAALASCPCNNR